MKRIITGLLAVAAWLALLSSQSFIFFWLIITAISLIAALEFFAICLQNEEKTLRPLLAAIALLPVAAAWFQRIDLVYVAFIAALMLLTVLAVFRAAQLRKPFDLLLKASFGATYTGLFTAHLILFMALPAGQRLAAVSDHHHRSIRHRGLFYRHVPWQTQTVPIHQPEKNRGGIGRRHACAAPVLPCLLLSSCSMR